MAPIESLSATLRVCLFVLFALAIWFRISSLGSIPYHDADESYEGVQIARMLKGHSFDLFTTSGNLLDPFFIALQSPFQLLARPSLWVLRVPAALSGLLAVLLTYVLGSRVLGRSTALTAAVVFATLPIAVVFSRVGYEYCQIPLAGVFALYFALRANTLGSILSVACSLLVHPVNAFLIPIVLPVYLTQMLRRHAADQAQQRKILIATALAGSAIVGALCFVLLRRPVVQVVLSHRPPIDWGQFLAGYERFLLYQYYPLSEANLAIHRGLFWGTVLLVVPAGMIGLVRDRQWDRISLVGGLAAGLTAFHLIAGPKAIYDFGTHRYGVVFIAPTVFAFACLVHATFARRAEEDASDRRLSVVHTALVVGVGFAMLLSVKLNWFDFYTAAGRESLWTLKSDTKEPFQQALSLIVHDAAHVRAAAATREPCLVVAEDYWCQKPLEYLASGHSAISIELWDAEPEGENDRQVERLRRGGYVVVRRNGPDATKAEAIEQALNSAFCASQIRRWDITDCMNHPSVAVYRVALMGARQVRSANSGASPAARR
jgi:4-amino-4-deoxy-L-arabinose transferase-like glycosyltransferase